MLVVAARHLPLLAALALGAASGADAANHRHPTLSPDRSRVAFDSDRDGSGRREVAWGAFPSWIDDRRIVFFAPVQGFDQLFSIDLAAGVTTQLTR